MFVVGMYGSIYFTHSTLYIMALLGAVEGLVSNDVRKAKMIRSGYMQKIREEKV
jgi:hypothetical protein